MFYLFHPYYSHLVPDLLYCVIIFEVNVKIFIIFLKVIIYYSHLVLDLLHSVIIFEVNVKIFIIFIKVIIIIFIVFFIKVIHIPYLLKFMIFLLERDELLLMFYLFHPCYSHEVLNLYFISIINIVITTPIFTVIIAIINIAIFLVFFVKIMNYLHHILLNWFKTFLLAHDVLWQKYV